MAKIYKVEFVVKCARKVMFSFPIDMLRYDGCYPATESDSNKIIWSITDDGSLSVNALEIKLVRAGAEKNWWPTGDRWQSFGWYVVDGSRVCWQ